MVCFQKYFEKIKKNKIRYNNNVKMKKKINFYFTESNVFSILLNLFYFKFF